MDLPKIIADIALNIPSPPTTGDLLKALFQAAEAGERKGYAQGVLDGQHHVSHVMNLTLEAMR
jgi:hypothetical protein